MTKLVAVIEGDGIGREVIPAAVEVLKATGAPLTFEWGEAGFETFIRRGTSVPKETLELAKRADAVLFGATSSPTRPTPGYQSAIRVLRRELGLYLNVRPARHLPVPRSREGVDLVIVRENSEGLYVGAERRYGQVAIADRVITYEASLRAARYAFELAKGRKRRLTAVHKANVLPLSDGLFLEAVADAAADYPEVTLEESIVDATAAKLVLEPERFDVLVMENLYGDILSDLTAALVGGLGLAPSANIGERHALFEPVHGSAPDIAGKGVANPTAAILSGAMLLAHLGFEKESKKVEAAVERTLAAGVLTPDLGGSASTREFTQHVVVTLQKGVLP